MNWHPRLRGASAKNASRGEEAVWHCESEATAGDFRPHLAGTLAAQARQRAPVRASRRTGTVRASVLRDVRTWLRAPADASPCAICGGGPFWRNEPRLRKRNSVRPTRY